jgi:membrane protease YdiL (CAAX protease family)
MPWDDLPLMLKIAHVAMYIGSIAVWFVVVQRLRRGKAILRFEPRRPVPWQGVDLALILLIFVLIPALAQLAIFGPPQSPRTPAKPDAPAASQKAPAITASPDEKPAAAEVSSEVFEADATGKLLFSAIATGWVVFRVRATSKDLGIVLSHMGSDLVLGIATFLATILPVMLIQYFLEDTKIRPYDHPLITALKNHPTVWMFAVVSLSAVIVAPFVEELLFRVLIQGCLEMVETKRRLLFNAARSMAAAVSRQTADDPTTTSNANDTARLSNVNDPDAATELAAASGPSAWPIIVSSAIFALMHWGQGLAPIPLFPFALILGYVYQRTHRIWPSLIAHLLLNGTSLVTLWQMTVNHPK